MRVSDSSRVLFVHVPKSAGSTIDRMFEKEVVDQRTVPGRARHAPYARLVQAEPELADYWSFGFVRNPWCRLVSWWSMLVDIFEKADAGHQLAIDRIARFPEVWQTEGEYRHDFSRFVLEATEMLPKLGRPQVVTLSGRGGLVDFVGRVENYDHDLAIVREKLGLPKLERVPRHNKSKHGHYSEYYTPETRKKVEEIYGRDIEAFGYTFETP
jgi:hypothetical protein